MNIKKDSARLDKRKIIILLPFWAQNLSPLVGKKENMLNKIKKLIPNDFGYIHYNYPTSLLNSNPSLTKKNFLAFMKTIERDISQAEKEEKKEIYFYAQSLGGLFAMILADKINVKKMVLICPGNTLTECFWNGLATKNLKEEMNMSGITFNNLNKIWKPLSPDSYFKSKARNTEYYIKLAKKDICIPYKNGLDLVRLLKKKNINYTLKQENLTHPITLLKECLFPYKSINYLTH